MNRKPAQGLALQDAIAGLPVFLQNWLASVICFIRGFDPIMNLHTGSNCLHLLLATEDAASTSRNRCFQMGQSRSGMYTWIRPVNTSALIFPTGEMFAALPAFRKPSVCSASLEIRLHLCKCLALDLSIQKFFPTHCNTQSPVSRRSLPSSCFIPCSFP